MIYIIKEENKNAQVAKKNFWRLALELLRK